MPPLISKAEMDVVSSGNEYDDETMSMGILEDIRDGRHSCPSVNSREARYRILYRIRQS